MAGLDLQGDDDHVETVVLDPGASTQGVTVTVALLIGDPREEGRARHVLHMT